MSKKKTHFEYIAEVKLINSNIEVIGQYIDSQTKIKHRCKVCGCEWEVRPYSVLNGRGCPECAKYKRTISNTKTHEQYVAEVALINQDIEIVGQYLGSDAKIEIKCKLCEYKWFARASDVLNKHGCPKCSYKAKTKTQCQYITELEAVNPNVIVIDEYKNSYTKIKHLCLICGNEWYIEPNTLLHGNNCPKCSRRKSHEQYVVELAIKNPNITVVGEYVDSNTKIEHRCVVCGYEWMLKPKHALYGCGCPSCKETYGEQQVKQWLIDNGIKYEYQKRFADCKNQRMLPFDFYLPDYNCCIEYDGAQHFKEVNLWGGQEYLSKRQYNDKIKNNYCKKNNICLVRIRYDEDVYEVLNSKLELIILNKAL